MDWTYYEWLDEQDMKWHLGCMPADKALAAQLLLGDRFHYLDSSMIDFEEE